MGNMRNRVVVHSGMKAFTSLTPQRAQTVMKPTRRPTLRLENLEDRLAPAINILQSGSFLSITGTLTTGALALETTTTPGQLEITGGGPTVTYSNVSSVSVNLGAYATGNFVFVNLEDGPLTGNLTINAGPSANNSVIVLDNAAPADPATDILGNLSISRANTVIVNALSVLGNVTINNSGYAPASGSFYTVGGGAITGTLSITGTAGVDLAAVSSTTVGGNLSVNLGGNANAFPNTQSATIDTGTVVQGSLSILGGAGGTTANLDATVNGNVTINFGGGATLGNALTFTAGALVGGTMSVSMGTSAGTGNQITVFEGTINGNLTISLGKSSANLINYAAVVNGRQATISYQMGTNTFNLLPGASMPNPLGRMSLYMAKGGSNTFNQSTPIDWPMTVNI